MDKAQAIVSFWNTVSGLPVYDENSIPETASLPYIACEINTASFEHDVPLTASLYYYDTSWAAISQKAEAISKKIREMRGSATLIDGGRVRIWEGETPLCQRMADINPDVKRIVLNVMVEFLTDF